MRAVLRGAREVSLRLQHIEQKVEGKATVESVNMTWCQRGEQIIREGKEGGGSPIFLCFLVTTFLY